MSSTDDVHQGSSSLSTTALYIVRFCAVECELQMSGERSVGWMVNAWAFAEERSEIMRPRVSEVLVLGQAVEPVKNARGFRECAVHVGWEQMPDWRQVPRMVDNLIEARDRLTPAEFFHQYEQIHPFVDGNGRTGQILYNWLNGTLNAPEWAPNFFGDDRRTAGDGAPIYVIGADDA